MTSRMINPYRLDGGGGIGPSRLSGGGGAMGGLQTANQGLNQISEAVNQINQATGGGGVSSMPSGGGDFGDASPGVDYPSGNVSIRDKSNTAASLLKSLGLKKGGKVPSASKRGDGIATKGKTKGRFV